MYRLGCTDSDAPTTMRRLGCADSDVPTRMCRICEIAGAFPAAVAAAAGLQDTQRLRLLQAVAAVAGCCGCCRVLVSRTAMPASEWRLWASVETAVIIKHAGAGEGGGGGGCTVRVREREGGRDWRARREGGDPCCLAGGSYSGVGDVTGDVTCVHQASNGRLLP